MLNEINRSKLKPNSETENTEENRNESETKIDTEKNHNK